MQAKKTTDEGVTLSKTGQDKGGIVTAPVRTILHRREIKAYGTVLDLNDFFSLRAGFTEALAQVQKTRADLAASQKAYERLQSLYRNARDVSARALQEAEAAWRSDQADARAAKSTLDSVKVQAQQQWGDRLAGWLMQDSPDLERLKRQEEVLVQIAVPPDASSHPAPPVVRLQTPSNTFAEAVFIAPSPRIDPRIQGQSFYYKTAAKTTGLRPGMNLLAFLPAGRDVPGAIIPSSAVVFRDGKSWAYVQQAPGRFVRREVRTETPVKGGWFVTQGFRGGELLVVTGAQLLLSKEFLPVKTEEEDED